MKDFNSLYGFVNSSDQIIMGGGSYILEHN